MKFSKKHNLKVKLFYSMVQTTMRSQVRFIKMGTDKIDKVSGSKVVDIRNLRVVDEFTR
jgi:hypothetical protein